MSSQSSSTTITETISVVNENMTSVLVKNVQTATANTTVTQTIDIVNYGIMKCDLNLSNVAVVKVDLQSALSATNASDVKNLMKAAIDQAADSSTKQTQEFLSTPFSDQDSNTNITLTSSLKNIVDTKISNETINQCIATSNVTQGQTLTNYGVISGKACNFNNHAQVTIAVSCMLNAVTQAAVANESLTVAAQSAAARIDQENTGAAASITSSMSSTSSISAIVMYIIIAVVVLGVVGLVFALISKKGKRKQRDD